MYEILGVAYNMHNRHFITLYLSTMMTWNHSYSLYILYVAVLPALHEFY